MGLLLFLLVAAWLVSEAVKQAKLDYTYAKQGMVSPRMEAKYGNRAKGLVEKYGFFDFLRDAWRDYWPRRTQALIAARDARDATGRRVRLRDRLAAAKRWVRASFRKAEPEKEPGRSSPEPAPDLPPPPPMEPTPDPPTTVQPEPATGEPMSVTTGEVVNYETTIADIDERVAEVQNQIDLAQITLNKLTDAKASVDTLQQVYAPTAEAVSTKLDHEVALGLDGTTIGHAAATVDALPVGAVDTMYDAVEAVEAMIRDRLIQAEAALAALIAERAHLVATYGDAHTTVAANLGGDARFLDSGGPVVTAATPA